MCTPKKTNMPRRQPWASSFDPFKPRPTLARPPLPTFAPPTQFFQQEQDRDCEGSWTEFVDPNICSKGETKTRTYNVTQQKEGNGRGCDYEHGETDSMPCDRDCHGEWSEWSVCVNG